MVHRFLVRFAVIGVAAAALISSAACSGGASSSDGRVAVVASTAVWGSLAVQVGGDRVVVTSLLQGQSVDAHDYEPKPADGRAVARARYVIVNGLGYDSWASKLLAANRSSDRSVLDVGELVGLRDGANPHRWYAPDDVRRVVDQIAVDLARIDPAHAAEYEQRRAELLTSGMREYFELIAAIRRAEPGAPVGATESVAAPLVEALGLRLVSPPSFLAAVAEGIDPTPQDKATMEAQIRGRQLRVLIVNRQNLTPDVQRLVEAAKAVGVATVEVTETPPVDTSFQAWQVAQLRALAAALEATR